MRFPAGANPLKGVLLRIMPTSLHKDTILLITTK